MVENCQIVADRKCRQDLFLYGSENVRRIYNGYRLTRNSTQYHYILSEEFAYFLHSVTGDNVRLSTNTFRDNIV